MRLLSDLLPLRVAADLPRYRADAARRVLPWVYGRVTLAPVPLDDAGLEWLVADHPVVAVESVRSAGKALDGWQLVQRLDETGRAIATIRLTRTPEGDLAAQGDAAFAGLAGQLGAGRARLALDAGAARIAWSVGDVLRSGGTLVHECGHEHGHQLIGDSHYFASLVVVSCGRRAAIIALA